MEKKILLFNYFLHKASGIVQKEFGFEDEKVALLSLIFSKSQVFRRYTSGCSSETIKACNTQYAEDLFWIVCLEAKTHGNDLLRHYHLKASYVFGGQKQWGASILVDDDLKKHCERLYPAAAPKSELYANFVAKEEISEVKRSVDVELSMLELPTADADTQAMDAAIMRLYNDKSFVQLFSIGGKFDFYGKSLAHKYYAEYYAAAIPAV